jgi:4'-phosphopantetheinyl transferase
VTAAPGSTATLENRVTVVWARPSDVLGDVVGDGGDSATAAMALLDDVELSRVARLRRAADRDRFVAGHALLRLAVGRLMDVDPSTVAVTSTCPDCGAPHGRPVITVAGRPAPNASLSHSGDRVIVALSHAGPVGVDVEPLEDDAFADDALDDVALTPDERAGVQALAPRARPAARARLWVRKEAFLKATGQGLREPPSEVAVTAATASGRSTASRLTDLDVGAGYAACLAVLTSAHPVVDLNRMSILAGHPFAPDASGRSGSSGS